MSCYVYNADDPKKTPIDDKRYPDCHAAWEWVVKRHEKDKTLVLYGVSADDGKPVIETKKKKK